MRACTASWSSRVRSSAAAAVARVSAHVYSGVMATPSASTPSILCQSEEVATQTVVERGSRADGKSLKELQVETETGMHVLAVQRGRRWIYRPRPRFELQAGDRVISLGPVEGVSELDILTRAPAASFPSGY